MTGLVLIYTAVVCIVPIKFYISAQASLKYENNYEEETERIAHGKVAPKGKYPFMVGLYVKVWARSPKYRCGGSILNSDYILTACHCIRDENNMYVDPAKYLAATGSQDRGAPSEDIQTRSYIKVVGHPNCTLLPLPPSSDLGLVQVDSPFKMNDNVKPVSFISSQKHILWWWYSKFVTEGMHCQIPGWGKTQSDDEDTPLLLQEGVVELLSVKECSRAVCYLYLWCKPDGKRNICAAVSEDSSPCKGDSGGPLVCGGYIFAVTSAGPTSCLPTKTYIQKPVHFTDPLETLDFVKQFVPNYKGPSPVVDFRSSVPPFKYPFVVNIANVSDKLVPQSLCAASILTVSSVLTTCRCLRNLRYSREHRRFLDVAVISGVPDLFEDSLFAQRLYIIKIYTDFSCQLYKFKFLYDSGIAVINGKFPFATPHVRPLMMVTQNISKLREIVTEFQKSSLECVMATWGYKYDSPTRIRQNVFSEWKVRLFNPSKCQREICRKEGDACYQAFDRSDEICGEAVNFSQPCYGDKGGPLICRGYYFGLVSHNYQLCAKKNIVKITTVMPILQMIQTQYSDYEKGKKLQASTGNFIPLSAAIISLSIVVTIIFSFNLR